MVSSANGGMGKSLFVDARKEKMVTTLTIRIQGTTVDVVEIMERLKQLKRNSDSDAVFYHFDVAPTVWKGFNDFN